MKFRLLGVAVLAAGLTLPAAAQSDQRKVSGHLVDAVCAGNHAHEAGYAVNHENSCNLMPGCIKSGFSVITADNTVLKFDQKGNEQALVFVKATKKAKDVRVVVTGKVEGQTIAVSAIAAE